LRKNVDEDCAAWLNEPDKFIDPRKAPFQIFRRVQVVVCRAVSVVFTEIEFRICKNAVYRFVLQRRE
jgi:hypothetical protein